MAIPPPALKPGDTIGVMAPSSYALSEKAEKGIQKLEQLGFNVCVHPQTEKQHGQFAGTPEEKVSAFHEYIVDTDINAIIFLCGGNGAARMLDLIDYDLIRQHPKIIMGYSDITVLLNTITAKTGLITFHGPCITSFSHIDEASIQQTLGLLMNGENAIKLTDSEMIRDGKKEGVLWGGNLSVFQTLIGTAFAPDMRDALLFLEDTNDHISRYDRMICHIRLAGWLDHLSGLITGDFLNTLDNDNRPFGFSLKDIIFEHTDGLDIPVTLNAPFGHGEKLCTFPIGCRSRLEGKTLTLLESPVTD